MNEAQVFGRFIPDFGKVVAQMQYDMYHVYTVDEHTIIMLGILFKIEKRELEEIAPTASSVLEKSYQEESYMLPFFYMTLQKDEAAIIPFWGRKWLVDYVHVLE